MNFENKIAVVTGGGRGLGQEVSLALASLGATVVLSGRTAKPLEETKAAIEANGGKASVYAGDMADAESVKQFAAEVLDQYGQVDVLVNNAAIGGPSAPLWEVEVDEWKETLDINTTGPFLTSRAFLPSMIEKKSGSLVFVGSMTGKRELLNRTAYAASKIALVGLVRTLAWEVGPYGIRANIVSPGPMEGERIEWVLEQQAERENITVEAARSRLASRSPLGRFVSTQDVVNAILFLASDDAGSTTGEDLNVSSGICAY